MVLLCRGLPFSSIDVGLLCFAQQSQKAYPTSTRARDGEPTCELTCFLQFSYIYIYMTALFLFSGNVSFLRSLSPYHI